MSIAAWRYAGVIVAAGAVLGAVDFLAQRVLPYPWANLANSGAVWALGAFALGRWARRPWWRTALAGVGLLLVAVETYYLTAATLQHDDWANLWGPTALTWLGAGVVIGAIFGTAGGWSRDGTGWRRRVGTALPVAVLLAEAAIDVYRSGQQDAGYRSDSLWTAGIVALLGVGLAWVLGGSTRGRLATLAISLPLALLGFGVLRMADYGG